MAHTHPITVLTVEEAPHSEVHIRTLIPQTTLEALQPRALERLAKTVVVDGFRPGHVPPHIAQTHLPPEKVLSETIKLAVEPHLETLLAQHAPRAVATPRIYLEEQETAAGGEEPSEGVRCTIVVPVYPEISLPDYRAIARDILKKAPQPSVQGEEAAMERALLLLRKEHALKVRKELNPEDTSTIDDIDEASLPPLTDEVAQALGPFRNVTELKEALRKDMTAYLAQERLEATRRSLVEALVKEAGFPVPRVFVELELMRLLEQLSVQLAAVGQTIESFLEAQGEQKDALLQSWQEAAEQRVRAQLILNAIAEAENLTVDEERVRSETDRVMAHNPSLVREEVEAFIRQQLRNEAVLQFLLDQSLSTSEADHPSPADNASQKKRGDEQQA